MLQINNLRLRFIEGSEDNLLQKRKIFDFYSLVLLIVVLMMTSISIGISYAFSFIFCVLIILFQNSENHAMERVLLDPLSSVYKGIGGFIVYFDSMSRENKPSYFNIGSKDEGNASNSNELEALKSEIRLLKKKNKKLKKVKKTQQTLLAMISHDMKSPLSSLMGLVSLVRKNLDEGIDLKSIVEQLDNKIRNTSQNVDNILEWSKSLHNGIEISPDYFSINESLDLSLNFVKDSYSKKQIEVDINIGEKVSGYGDKNVFQVVLRNLLSNAFKFTPVGGHISIDVDTVNKKDVAIKIKDSGIGIPQDKLKIIFAGGNSMRGTNGEKGSGLGLLICKKFIDANHGNISVTSQENEGAVFTFSIPTVPQLDKNGALKQKASKIFISL